jgi:fimbrial isopeptide formation D2 family protein/LPXTG-motif cell wall-anchored protein
MKHVKHMLVAVLTVFLAAVLAVPAFAADGHTISLSSTDTHTYNVYQVLTGTLGEGTHPTELGDPKWGADATAAAKATDVQAFIDSLEGKSNQELADAVAAVVDTTGAGRGTIDKDTPMRGLATGYYILVDKTALTGDHEKDTQALHVIQVVNDINGIQIKWGTTSDEKIITTDTLGKDEGTNTINGAADNVSVGDTVNYQIKAHVPANANLYNYFYFIINDTLSDGLTFGDDIQVYKGSVADANKLAAGTDYSVRTATTSPAVATGHTFEVGLTDAKSLAGQDIIVTYSAVLNENAVIGEKGNPNTSTVKYSTNPNDNYDGKTNPSFPATDEDGAFGETPVTETKTYTTGIEIQKVDQDGKVLTGATFELSGESTKTVLTVAETFVVDPDGNYYKLKDGTYTKTAPTTEGEYMVLTPGATAGYVEDSSYDGADKKVVDGKTYRPYAPATDEGKDVYVLTTGNAHLYDNTETKYKKVENKTATDVKSTHKSSMAVNENGLARFDGLGAGTYTIEEIVTPAGYNTVPKLTVTVSFNAQGEKVWSFSGGSGGYDADEGIYKITIENNKGTELPETGGMGTTILYTVGGIMVIAGIVMFLTKRRMASIEK